MSRVLDVEYPHIVGGRYNRSIVRVGHELDGKDITAMARHYRCCKAELRGGRFGVVGVDVDAMVVRTRGEEAA